MGLAVLYGRLTATELCFPAFHWRVPESCLWPWPWQGVLIYYAYVLLGVHV